MSNRRSLALLSVWFVFAAVLGGCKKNKADGAASTATAEPGAKTSETLSATCRANDKCKSGGFCEWNGTADCDPAKEPVKCCQPATEEDCQQSLDCQDYGYCSRLYIKWIDGTTTLGCSVKSDAVCERSEKMKGAKAVLDRANDELCSGADNQDRCVCYSK